MVEEYKDPLDCNTDDIPEGAPPDTYLLVLSDLSWNEVGDTGRIRVALTWTIDEGVHAGDMIWDSVFLPKPNTPPADEKEKRGRMLTARTVKRLKVALGSTDKVNPIQFMMETINLYRGKTVTAGVRYSYNEDTGYTNTRVKYLKPEKEEEREGGENKEDDGIPF